MTRPDVTSQTNNKDVPWYSRRALINCLTPSAIKILCVITYISSFSAEGTNTCLSDLKGSCWGVLWWRAFEMHKSAKFLSFQWSSFFGRHIELHRKQDKCSIFFSNAAFSGCSYIHSNWNCCFWHKRIDVKKMGWKLFKTNSTPLTKELPFDYQPPQVSVAYT